LHYLFLIFWSLAFISRYSVPEGPRSARSAWIHFYIYLFSKDSNK